MRPFSHLCIFLFGTRTQGYTSPDDCPACWVTKACTFSSVYFPSPANLSSLLHSGTTSAGAQKVLPFPAASWDNKGSNGIALKGLGTCKEKSMLKEYRAPQLPALSFLLHWSLQGGHWTWPLQGLLDSKCQTATHNAGAHSLLLPLLRGSPAREEVQACIYKFVCSRSSLSKRTFSPWVQCCNQWAVKFSLPFPTCQYVF